MARLEGLVSEEERLEEVAGGGVPRGVEWIRFLFSSLAPFLVEQNLLFVTLVCIVLDVECNVHARN